MQPIVLGIITITVSIAALIFSILAYKRGASLENENLLFKLKIDIYSRILLEIRNLVDGLQDHLKEVTETLNGPSIEIGTKLDEQAKHIDILCFEFSDFIVNHSLIIPEIVLEKLLQFTTKIVDNQQLPDHYTVPVVMENFITEMLDDANNINIALRNDLHIEKLNISMYKRLH
ncbi:MAG: hypothetical protein JWQ27_2200 [Ferruginibacter sp.]|nr:hypothetical protein [Ferruginibacter sp.]